MKIIDEELLNEVSTQAKEFLCRMTGKTDFESAIRSFKHYDHKTPMISQNGCLMLFVGGFKAASAYKDVIYGFLNS